MDFCDVTVLTATYNRAGYLGRLYESLQRQKDKHFQWLVIDDGSTDATETLIRSFSPDFELDYYKKQNGGKHTALNYSHPYIRGKYLVMVDSDDFLEDTAIETIRRDWAEYGDNDSIACLSYLKRNTDGQNISELQDEEVCISDHIRFRLNGKRGGDRCEVLRTAAFKRYPLPEYPGERFMSEGYLWNSVAREYKTVYINRAIYIAEYLEGGLSKSGRRLRIESPRGMIDNCRMFFDKRVNTGLQIKEMWLYWAYAFFAKLSPQEAVKKSGRPVRLLINLPFGIALYLRWKSLYGRKNG